MRRAAPLVPFSHDHQHTLAEALRLRRAETLPEPTRHAAGRDFLEYYESEVIRHFRQEEDDLFPLLARHAEAVPELLIRALAEHQLIRAAAAALADDVRSGAVDGARLRSLGERIDEHVRLEERSLFPLIEQTVPAAALAALPGRSADPADAELAASPGGDGPAGSDQAALVADLAGRRARGPVWGVATEDLNATALRWPAGHTLAEHVNEERDVLIVVVEGSGVVSINAVEHALVAPAAVVVVRGSWRSLRAGADGITYVSAHLRRERLQIAGRLAPSSPAPGL